MPCSTQGCPNEDIHANGLCYPCYYLEWVKTPYGRKCHNKSNLKWQKTEKGKTSLKRATSKYARTEKGKAAQKRGNKNRGYPAKPMPDLDE
ncbi:MAG: hypothetical protein WC623_22415 [Pedobacter sp.]|uniref:hypothetical protein n=1 Tax=Pedobacter sp. TaxID=1411316 RepID=UPI00356151E2